MAEKVVQQNYLSIAEENYNLIYFVVNKYVDMNKYNTEDLIGAGQVGYTKALNNFDESKGVKFSTYAVRCIHNEILTYLKKENIYIKNNLLIKKTTFNDGSESMLNTVIDNLAQKNGEIKVNSLDDILIEKEEESLLYEALSLLSEIEQYVIKSRYGLYNSDIKTQKELGEILNFSQSYINRIEKGALSKLFDIMTKNEN